MQELSYFLQPSEIVRQKYMQLARQSRQKNRTVLNAQKNKPKNKLNALLTTFIQKDLQQVQRKRSQSTKTIQSEQSKQVDQIEDLIQMDDAIFQTKYRSDLLFKSRIDSKIKRYNYALGKTIPLSSLQNDESSDQENETHQSLCWSKHLQKINKSQNIRMKALNDKYLKMKQRG